MSDTPVVILPLPASETSVAGGNRTVIIGGQPVGGTTLSSGDIAVPGGVVTTR